MFDQIDQWLVAICALFVAFHALVLAVAGFAKLIAISFPQAQAVVDACMKLSTDVGWILDLLRKFVKPPPGSGSATLGLLLVLTLGAIPACGALLDNIPPGTTVCVEVTVVGITVRECATNGNETAKELEERALAKATKQARGKGLLK